MEEKTRIFKSDFINFKVSLLSILEKYIQQFKEALSDSELLIYNCQRYLKANEIRRFITFYEMFIKILRIQGSIFQAVVLKGNSLLSYAHLVENKE